MANRENITVHIRPSDISKEEKERVLFEVFDILLSGDEDETDSNKDKL